MAFVDILIIAVTLIVVAVPEGLWNLPLGCRVFQPSSSFRPTFGGNFGLGFRD